MTGRIVCFSLCLFLFSLHCKRSSCTLSHLKSHHFLLNSSLCSRTNSAKQRIQMNYKRMWDGIMVHPLGLSSPLPRHGLRIMIGKWLVPKWINGTITMATCKAWKFILSMRDHPIQMPSLSFSCMVGHPPFMNSIMWLTIYAMALLVVK